MTKKKAFLVANIIFPLLLGTVFYFFTSKDVIFVKVINSLYGKPVGTNHVYLHSGTAMLMHCYVMDALWAYALFFALYFSIDNNTARVKTAFMIAAIFSTVVEVLQLSPAIPGIFDAIDILVEILAEAVAVLIIKTQYEEAKNICKRK